MHEIGYDSPSPVCRIIIDNYNLVYIWKPEVVLYAFRKEIASIPAYDHGYDSWG